MEEKPLAPVRQHIPGPQLTKIRKDKKKSFAVTDNYFRGLNKGIENLLKAAQTIEHLEIKGTIPISSMVETTKAILCCKYTEEFDSVALGFTDGVVRLLKVNSNELSHTFSDEDTESQSAPVTSIKHRPVSKNYPISNTLTCTYANGCVKCWNHSFKQCVYTIKEDRQTLGISYHPKLPKFVTFGDDTNIFLYDEETRTQERILSASGMPTEADGHASRIFAACFHPKNNQELISGGWDDVVQFWDLRQPYASRHLSGIHLCGEGLDISTTGTEILTCAWQKENPLQLWDYGSGSLITSIQPDEHQSLLYTGKYLSNDYMIVGGTDKNIIRLIDTSTFTTVSSISNLPGGIYCMDTGPVKRKKGETPNSRVQQVSELPKIAFCCGKKLYQIDFS